jgi:hypothetical protein
MSQNWWPRDVEGYTKGHVRATVTLATWSASLDSECYGDFATIGHTGDGLNYRVELSYST